MDYTLTHEGLMPVIEDAFYYRYRKETRQSLFGSPGSAVDGLLLRERSV